MIKEYRGAGPHCEVAVSGHVLTIAGSDYDLDALQTDSQRTIDIVNNDMYMANVIIPPATYKVVSVDDDENMELQPVEMDRVGLILWTKGETNDDNDHN